MEALFLKIVNLSLTAGWLVLAVILLRAAFRKAPKWMICMLWGLVGLRLICPVSFKSTWSLIPSAEPFPQDFIETAVPHIQSGLSTVDNLVNPILTSSLTPAAGASVNPTQVWSFVLSRIWIIGAAAMLLYAFGSYIVLRRRLSTATLYQKSMKQSERIASPFVLGFFRPVIYLPYKIADADLEYVIAHEQAHITRKDHWWKGIGFVLLSVYWFNPLMWAAYILFGRDIESACDEKVIRSLSLDERRAYSTALLHCSIHRRRIAACPLAFGEIGIKERVKAVMNYKKPAFWIILTAAASCVIAAVCFLTNPAKTPADSGKLPPDEAGFLETAPEQILETAPEQTPETSLPNVQPDRSATLFSEMPKAYWFLSGAGAWSTTLYLEEDGSFSGLYEDADVSEIWRCEFTGRFSAPVKVNDYTYSVHVESLNYPDPGEVFQEGDQTVTTVEPYGLDHVDEILIYLPGCPISTLSEEAYIWVNASGAEFWVPEEEKPDTLPFYALNNVNEQMVFTAIPERYIPEG